MSTCSNSLRFCAGKTVTLLLSLTLLTGIWPLKTLNTDVFLAEAEEEKASEEDPHLGISSKLPLISGNSLLAISPTLRPVEKVDVVVTAYSSTVWETDEDPFITASGKFVADGIVATNLLPFGTKITIPEVYGEKVFVVEDRMNPRSLYHIDVWFPDYWDALDFGAKRTYIEILD